MLAVAVGWMIATQKDDISALVQNSRPVWLLMSTVASSSTIWVGGWFWNCAIKASNPASASGRKIWSDTVSATSRTMFARYLPGGIWAQVGRAVIMAKKYGYPAKTVTYVTVLEMFTSLTAAVICGLSLVAIYGTDNIPELANIPVHPLWLLLLAAVLFFVSSPPMLGTKIIQRWADTGTDIISITWREYLKMVGVNSVLWGGQVLSFLFYLRAFPGSGIDISVGLAGVFLLVWVAGQVVPFAVQGAGVFEFGMAVALGGGAAMMVLVGGWRLVILIRDVAALLISEYLTLRADGGHRVGMRKPSS